MATLTQALTYFAQDTDANFRNWASFVHNVFTLPGGWVNTSDTNQINLTTATKPSLAWQKVGYKVYRMNDSLQATKPVFIRIDFGSSYDASFPTIFITLGTGSDGAGNITGLLAPTWAIANTVTNNNGYGPGFTHYGSASSNRVAFALATYPRIIPKDNMWFVLERSKNADGSDNGNGLYVAWSTNYTSQVRSKYIPFSGPSMKEELGLHFILGTASVGNPVLKSNASRVVIPYLGSILNPFGTLVVVRDIDFGEAATLYFSINGTMRKFQQLGSNCNSVRAASEVVGNYDTATRVCILFE